MNELEDFIAGQTPPPPPVTTSKTAKDVLGERLRTQMGGEKRKLEDNSNNDIMSKTQKNGQRPRLGRRPAVRLERRGRRGPSKAPGSSFNGQAASKQWHGSRRSPDQIALARIQKGTKKRGTDSSLERTPQHDGQSQDAEPTSRTSHGRHGSKRRPCSEPHHEQWRHDGERLCQLRHAAAKNVHATASSTAEDEQLEQQ